MCFFPYSPLHKLSVEYASETILLLERRSGGEYYATSALHVDILIKNEGLRTSQPGIGQDSSNLSSFYIIYPNSIFEISEESEDNRSRDNYLKRIVDFEDVSHEFYTESNNNWMYHQPGNSLYAEEIDPNYWKVTITQPHPSTLEERTLTGFIKGNAKISPALDVFDDRQTWDILLKNNYTLLKVEFDYSIQEGENRLLRFLIKPRATGRSKHKFIKRWFKLLISDDLYYSYEIFGPYNVEYRIGSTLKSYVNQIEYSKKRELEPIMRGILSRKNLDKRSVEDAFSNTFDELKTLCEGILTTLKTHIGNPQFTKVIDWRINIQPGKFKMLRNIREYGAAKICGVNKNLIKEDKSGKYLVPTTGDHGGKIVYQWKAGKINICSATQPISMICQSDKELIHKCQEESHDLLDCYPSVGNFTMGFDCKLTSRYWLWLVYYAFIYEMINALGWLWKIIRPLLDNKVSLK